MAKIIKVASSTPRIANQFRTSRTSTTNPFKYQSFEGNTLDVSAFADVFETSAPKEANKLKLIASSVAGSMHRIGAGIAEPIINFVNRVCEGISSAWHYAANTNISDVGAIKGISAGLKNVGDVMNKPISLGGISELMNKPIEMPGSHAIDSAVSGVKAGLGILNVDVLDLGKGIGSKWAQLISKMHSEKKISADMSVSELEALWKSEIQADSLGEAA